MIHGMLHSWNNTGRKSENYSVFFFCFFFPSASPRGVAEHEVKRCQTRVSADSAVKCHRAGLKQSLYHHVRNSINIIDQRSGLGSFLHEYTGRKWLLF